MTVPIAKLFFSFGIYEKLNFNWDFISDTMIFEDFKYQYSYRSRGSINDFKFGIGYEILSGFYTGLGVSRIYGTLIEEWVTEVFPYGDARYDTLKYVNSGYEYSGGITLFRKKIAFSSFISYLPFIDVTQYTIFRGDTIYNYDKEILFKNGINFSSSFILFPDKKYSFTGNFTYGTGNEFYDILRTSLNFNRTYLRFGDSFGVGFISRNDLDFLFLSYGISILLETKGIFWFSTVFKFSKDVQSVDFRVGMHIFEKWRLRKKGWY